MHIATFEGPDRVRILKEPLHISGGVVEVKVKMCLISDVLKGSNI